LEEIDEEIRRPGGMGRMRGKLNELWALIGAVKAVRERDAKGVSDGNVEWAVVDEEGLAQIAQARFPCCTRNFLAISLHLLDSWPNNRLAWLT
jgi:nuclear pore complex protein Nup54